MDLKDYTLELFPDEKRVEVSGSISGIFQGLHVSDEAKEKAIANLIGLPIKNDAGDVVGEITRFDLTNDIWYGILYKFEKEINK